MANWRKCARFRWGLRGFKVCYLCSSRRVVLFFKKKSYLLGGKYISSSDALYAVCKPYLEVLKCFVVLGDKCILVDKQWYFPNEFEQLAGKAANKNWKMSIRCMDTSLGKLIQVIQYIIKSRHISLYDSESEEGSSDSTGADLDPRIVPSGTCGRSIRTEDSWLTPVDFVKEASCQTDTISWQKHIKCEGRPLGELLKEKILKIHSLLCRCIRCVPGSEDLNDDECWICRKEGTETEKLVECDECPRSFHQQCHLPHVPDSLLKPMHCKLIQTPMWLDHIADKLQDNKYQTVGHFESDIQLVFKNCTLYNRVGFFIRTFFSLTNSLTAVFLFFQDNPEFHDIGIKMKECFVKEFNKVFKI
uniref:Uncharacterized protein n=1 Tax=Neogobius melanostomus TaxID=47308 RepID=A0A8C6T8X8_9GOBI